METDVATEASWILNLHVASGDCQLHAELGHELPTGARVLKGMPYVECRGLHAAICERSHGFGD